MPLSSGARRPVVRRPGSSSPSFQEGDAVQAKYKGGQRFFSGKIARVNGDGTFDIDYDDGDFEAGVLKHKIRAAPGQQQRRIDSDSSVSPRGNSRESNRGPSRGSSRGNSRGRGGGGEEEDDAGGLAQKIAAKGSAARRAFELYDKTANGKINARDFGRVLNGLRIEFNPGDLRDAMQTYGDGRSIDYNSLLDASQGGGSGLKGSDSRSGGSGSEIEEILRNALRTEVPEKKLNDLQDSFEMLDQDGSGKVSTREFERNVERARLGLQYEDLQDISAKLSSGGQVKYKPFVKALRNVSSSQSGRRSKSPSKGRSGSMDRRGGSGGGTGSVAFRPGQKVEARYRKGKKFFPGVIDRARPDGTYDIFYDDGDQEQRVDASLIRSIGGGVAVSDTPEEEGLSDDMAVFQPGQKVEARYKKGRKYFPGVIDRARPDGTYDIFYDDGDKEMRVPTELIRSVTTSRVSNSPTRTAASRSRSSGRAAGAFRPGQKIEAKYKRGRRFFPGVIERERPDGTYDILYDDGDTETRVPADIIRAVGGGVADSETDADGPLAVGDRCEARYKGGKRMYKGEITRVNSDGSYDIKYDDGDSERRVRPENVKPLGPPSSPSRNRRGASELESSAFEDSDVGAMDDKIQKGDRVEAKYKGGAKFYAGVVERVYPSGACDIAYDDGDFEKRVPARRIRKIAASSRGERRSPSKGRDPISKGTRVEARYKGGKRYFPGTVSRVNADGSFAINYDDGDRELRVPAASVRPLDPMPTTTDATEDLSDEPALSKGFKVGDRVEAKYKGGRKFFKGTIDRVNRDGTYAISYDDGDKERAVPPENIRLLNDGLGTTTSADELTFQRGDKVEAKYKGGSRFFKGEITRVNVNGTYDINYDDGDRERGVPADRIRPLVAGRSPSRGRVGSPAKGNGRPTVGSKVEARYKGGKRFYKGEITRENADGTFAISYADGDRERSVPLENIRLLQESRNPDLAGFGLPTSDSDVGIPPFQRGDRVEGRYKGGRKFFPGKVLRVNSNGTVDIRYDDGDLEKNVRAADVRALGAAARSRSRSRDRLDPNPSELETTEAEAYQRGDKVEARFKNGRKYYPGQIARVNPDGTYDIAFDDGDSERRVPGDRIKGLGGSRARSPRSPVSPTGTRRSPSGSKKGNGLFVGAKVEARYKNGRKYYSGTITRENRDGTFDISYDDGDRESRVAVEKIRSLEKAAESGSDDSDLDGLKVGDRVEAKYRGGARLYKGEIVRANRDGTFDINYDDGDKERNVVPKNIKKLSSRSSPVRRSVGRASPGRGSPGRGSPARSKDPAKGDRVEARYKGGRKFYKGVIERVYKDGSCDIRYDDGDFERRVPTSMMNLDTLRPSSVSRGARDRDVAESEAESELDEPGLVKGSRVEARFKGKAKYYKGTITRVNADGTYAIDYDDGDREFRVKPELIRSLDKRSPKRASPSRRSPSRRVAEEEDESASDRAASFSRGETVEARYKGGRKYYKGVITRVRPDDTYDIDYDDGDRESRVPARSIRSLQDKAGSEEIAEILRRVLKKGVRKGSLDNYHEVFDMFDVNGDGYISRLEFGRALDKLGLKFTHGELKQLVKNLDTNRDGRISYKEFMRLIKGEYEAVHKSRSSKSPVKRSRRSRSVSSSGSSSSSGSGGELSRLSKRKKSPRKTSKKRSTSRRSRRSARSSSASSSSSDGDEGSQWSTEDDSAADETWDSDSDAEQEQVVFKFEVYLGRKVAKDKKKKFKRAFERVDKKKSAKIRSEDLERALRYMGIRKRVSRALQKRLVEKYGHGSSSSIFYRDLINGCKLTLEAAKDGKGPSFESQVENILERIKTLTEGRDLGQDLTKLDKLHDFLLPKKAIISYLVKLGFRKSERSVLARFLSYFEQDGSKGKVPYQDFAAFCMSKDKLGAADMPNWKRAITGLDIQNGMKKLREEREKREREGVDPLVWQVLSKLRQVIADALNAGIAKDYSDAFEMFDVDKDGKISRDEMAAALARLGFDVNAEEITKIMVRLDESGKGGFVDYKHFLLFCTRGSDRDQWALGPNGEVVGNTYAGELESSVRQKIRKTSLIKKTGHHSLLRVFRSYDKENRGHVDKKALRKIASTLKWQLTNEDLACLVARFDLKGEDKFAYKDFVNFLTLEDDAIYNVEQRVLEFVRSMLEKGADMKECFELFDRNHDGKISPKELCGTMMKLGFPVSEEEAKELIRRIDIDRDGKINFVEFTRAFGPKRPTNNNTLLLTNDENQKALSNSPAHRGVMELVTQKTFQTDGYTDWTGNLLNPDATIPLAPKGSVGEWLEKVASPLEKRNFFAFLHMISNFEKTLGLQQSRGESDEEKNDGEIVLQLGTKLKVSMKFHT